MTRWRFAAAILLFGFIGSFPIMLGAGWREIQLGTGGTVVTGVVTGKDTYTAARNPDFCVLLYSFVDTRSGQTIKSSDGQDCRNWPEYDGIAVGDPVEIRYLPDNPDANRLESRPFRFEEIGAGALWVAIALGLIALAVFWLRHPRVGTGPGQGFVGRRVGESGGIAGVSTGEADPLLPDGIRAIAGLERVSVSDLQQRLNVPYGRAQRIFDQLAVDGYLGAFDGTGSREVRHR